MKIVLSGISIAGKTDVLIELFKQGYSVVPDLVRPVLEQRSPHEFDTRSELERIACEKEILQETINTFSFWDNYKKPVFFNKGLMDFYTYVDKYELTKHFNRAFLQDTRLKPDKVFVFEPFPGPGGDYPSKIDYNFRRDLHSLLEKNYEQSNLKPVRVPLLTSKERTRYVLDRL